MRAKQGVEVGDPHLAHVADAHGGGLEVAVAAADHEALGAQLLDQRPGVDPGGRPRGS